MPEISKRALEYKGSAIRRIAKMLEAAASTRDIISFGGGAPSLAPPKEVIEYYCEKIKKDPQKAVSYCSTEGPLLTRTLISENLKDEEKIDIKPEEIILTIGGTEALATTFLTLINPGEEVIIADPTYLMYAPTIKFMEAKPVPIKVNVQEKFQLTPEKINEKITKKTKAIMLLTPDNPTGTIQDKKNVKGIVEICEGKDLWLITDDIYKDITYDEKFINSRTFGAYEKTVTCCSFSKMASLPGLRAGYAYGPKKAMEKISGVKQLTSLTAPRTALFAVDKFFENNAAVKKKYLKETVVPTYRKRRDSMQAALTKYLPEVEFSKPEGAFYFFPDFTEALKKTGMNEEQFADKLFAEKDVVIVPGTPFGDNGKNHFRMTFVSENEKRIEEGVSRIADLIKKNSR